MVSTGSLSGHNVQVVRKLPKSLTVLKDRMGVIRGIKFSPGRHFMATKKTMDFVHIYDMKDKFSEFKEVCLFGKIDGLSLNLDTKALFVSIAAAYQDYESLLEFSRRHQFHYMKSFIRWWRGRCRLCEGASPSILLVSCG